MGDNEPKSIEKSPFRADSSFNALATHVRRRDRFDEFGNIFESLPACQKIKNSVFRHAEDDCKSNRLFLL